MPTDELNPGARTILNFLIQDSAGYTGLQARLEAIFGVGPHRPKAQLRYAYDSSTQSVALIEAPLERPLVTLITTSRIKLPSLYRKDQHPTLAQTFAWVRRFNMQWDIWGRTPVEVDALSDAVEREVPKMHAQLWAAQRVALVMDTFEDVPFEVQTGIFRSMARGYCQAAQSTTGP